MSLQDYEFWRVYCLHGVLVSDMYNFITQHLFLRKLTGGLITNLRFPYMDINDLFPCMGINYSRGHAVVLSGAYRLKSNTVGETEDVGIYYFDPGYGKEVMEEIRNFNNPPYIECYYLY